MVKRRADPKTMGKRLKALRGCRTKTGVAREIGISYSALCFYESGERFPSPENQKKLADYYGVTEESLFYTRD